MDIKLTHSLLTNYLKTTATPAEIADKLSLCGPTVDRLEQLTDDWLYHIEVITNRVDAASAFGIAREAHAILPQFALESQLENNPYDNSVEALGALPNNPPVTVDIVDTSLVPRFTCIALKNITIRPSPIDVQTTLEQVGERSINNVIDISNELTLKYGQPVHIFDLDRIANRTMIVRESHPQEVIETLDGRTHTLKGGDIIIEDGKGRLIDLCGIMGGELSAVTDTTQNILLFVQTYEPKRIRRTSLYTQERTLASQLFEKQPDPELVLPVLIEGVKLLQERAGGVIDSALLDIYPHPRKPTKIQLDLNWLEQFTGIPIPKDQVIDILHRLGFSTQQTTSAQLICGVPSWRLHDIAIKEDLAEEITRVYGYFRLPSVLPDTDIPAKATSPTLTLEMDTRNYLAQLGFTEVYNNSLISSTQLTQTGISKQNVFTLQNPLSEECLYMRPSLLPSLVQNIGDNQGVVPPPYQVFELSNTYTKDTQSPLAIERSTIGLVTVGMSFTQAKGYLEALFQHWHLKIALTSGPTKLSPLLSPSKAGTIVVNEELEVGQFGYIHPDYATALNVSRDTILAEINFEALLPKVSQTHVFDPVPLHTPIIEDLTFTLPPQTPVAPLLDLIPTLHPLIEKVTLKDVYNQNYTFTIIYRADDRTLSSEDVTPVRKLIVTTVQTQGLQLVGTI